MANPVSDDSRPVDEKIEPGLGSAGRSRLALLALTGLAGFCCLGFRLYNLQVRDGAESLRLARRNTVVQEKFPAPRGRIFDRTGRLLVSNEPEFQLVAVAAECGPVVRVSQRVGTSLGMPKKKVKAILDKAWKLGPLEPVVLARGLTTAQVVRATQLVRESKGLQLVIRERRKYNGDGRGAHIFGYTGPITGEELKELRPRGYGALDLVGKEGLERTYDNLLRGQKGIRQIAVDAMGRTVSSVEARAPKPGLDLVLSLDWKLQTFAEVALAEALAELRKQTGEVSGGAVVVMEAKTGKLLSLVSLPNYDPRLFSKGISEKDYARLLRDPGLPLVDRATRSGYSPGSTFKLITSSSALHEKLCTPFSNFYCGGSYAGASCFVRSGHGPIGFEASLAVSCDVVYYMLGVKLGIGRLFKHCAAYGLGKPTGLDLPGEWGGHLPDPRWKMKLYKEEWTEGDTVNLSIGQGFLLVTPLQMAVVTAAVANGGKVVRPHLVDILMSYQGRVHSRISTRPRRRLKISDSNLAAVRGGMRGAVTYGTGGAANSEIVHVAGKTGTVENSPSTVNPHGRNHTWFVSFAPYEKPEIVVVVCLEKSGGYGGGMCAPVARKIYDLYFQSRARGVQGGQAVPPGSTR